MPKLKQPGKILIDKLDFFTDQLDYIRRSSIGTPKKLRVDLSVANTDLKLDIAGNFFYIFQTNLTDDTLDIKVNEQREPAFTFFRGMGFLTPYYSLYITNTAQPNAYAIILFGTQAPDFLDVIDNRGSTIPTLDEIRDELRGDVAAEGFNRVAVGAAAGVIVAANANRKSVIIQHDPVAGVGFVYLGYDNTVLATKAIVCLAPGDTYSVDDYRGAIYGIRSGAATNAFYGEV